VNTENVPTWKYTVVHACGIPNIGNKAAMIALLKSLTAKHEDSFEKPWSFDPAAPWIQKLLDEIVAFETPIEKLEGKFKLNQNRKPEDRAGVMETLESGGDPARRAVGIWMTR
jgi:transcriptional regulator